MPVQSSWVILSQNEWTECQIKSHVAIACCSCSLWTLAFGCFELSTAAVVYSTGDFMAVHCEDYHSCLPDEHEHF